MFEANIAASAFGSLRWTLPSDSAANLLTPGLSIQRGEQRKWLFIVDLPIKQWIILDNGYGKWLLVVYAQIIHGAGIFTYIETP